jgi:hypothetical protein
MSTASDDRPCEATLPGGDPLSTPRIFCYALLAWVGISMCESCDLSAGEDSDLNYTACVLDLLSGVVFAAIIAFLWVVDEAPRASRTPPEVTP